MSFWVFFTKEEHLMFGEPLTLRLCRPRLFN